MIGGELVEVEGLIDGPAEALGSEVLEEEAVAGVFVNTEVLHGVLDSAGCVRDRKRSIACSNHLRESTRLEG